MANDEDEDDQFGQHNQRPRRTRAAARKDGPQFNEKQRSLSPGNSNGNGNNSNSGRDISPSEPMAKRPFGDFEGATTRSSILPAYHDRAIRVGPTYQAEVTSEEIFDQQTVVNENAREVCLWSPEFDDKYTNEQLDDFCTSAIAQYGFTIEQALGLLHWFKGDIHRALSEMSSYKPHTEEWSTEDKVLFDQAYQNYGKNFYKIRQLLQHKSLALLVEYYYLWKKSRGYSSYMDRERESEDDDDELGENGIRNLTCDNCEGKVNKVSNTDGDMSGGMLCAACTLYYKQNDGQHRPCTKRSSSPVSAKGQKCPTGFEKAMDQFVMFARRMPSGSDIASPSLPPSVPLRKGEDYVKRLDHRISVAKAKSQRLAGELTDQYLSKLASGIDSCRVAARPNNVHRNPRWTDDEKLFCVKAFSRYGKDFNAISEMLSTKTVEMVQEFYRENQTKYRLDALIAECEMAKKQLANEINEKQKSEGSNKISAIIDITDE